jgi:hypothetical protein
MDHDYLDRYVNESYIKSGISNPLGRGTLFGTMFVCILGICCGPWVLTSILLSKWLIILLLGSPGILSGNTAVGYQGHSDER